jgi:tRNA A37 threonylcarbamoyladenosine synthetase subunit TsaC/SUA5/YrdC
LFLSKQRPGDRPIPLVAGSIEQVRASVGTLTPLAERLALACWPGPLTLIIPASPALCGEVHLGTGKVAVRVPDHAVARDLLAARADKHYLITKDALARGKRVATSVSELAADHRREEIARMLAGAEITAEARAAAERLLRAAS